MRLPVTLAMRRSPHLLVVLVGAHGLAAAGLLPIDLSISVKLALLAGLAVSLVIAAIRRQPAALTLHSDGRLTLVDSHGNSVDGRVDAARSTVFPWLVVILVKTVERIIVLVLPVDALGSTGHRQLRLWLTWKLSAGSA